jgi:hypothetical protein
MSNRFLILIVGFLAGIIIGGILFRYLSFDLSKNIFIINKPSQVTQKDKPLKNNDDEREVNMNSGIGKKKPAEKTEPPVETSSLAVEENSTEKESKNNASPITDSLQAAIVDQPLDKNIEDFIIIKKDELLFSTPVNIINLDVVDVKAIKKDSLLQAASGIKEPSSNGPVIIEFWKSPVNYRGYRLTKNKLVLFGMHTQDFPKLYKLNDIIYLRSGEKVFRIEKSTDFKSYEQVQDPALLSRLN